MKWKILILVVSIFILNFIPAVSASYGVFYDSFENGGWNNLWVETGEGDWVPEAASSGITQVGSYVAHSDNCDSVCILTSINFSLTGYKDASITFNYGVTLLDAGIENLSVDVWNVTANAWKPVTSWTGTTQGSYTINLTGYGLGSGNAIRFVTYDSAATEFSEVDIVNVTAMKSFMQYELIHPLNLYEINATQNSIFNITVNATCRGDYTCTNANISLPIHPGWIPVTNCTDLQEMNKSLNSSYYLTNNIDCSDTVNWGGGAGFSPIGSGEIDCSVISATDKDIFRGEFDGNYFNITNLYINRPTECGVAIFGSITGENKTIKNVGLRNANITGKILVAGIIGTHDGNGTLILNSFVEGSYINGESYVSGLLSYAPSRNSGTIINNSYVKNITIISVNSTGIGGLFSLIYTKKIDNCYADGKIIITDGNATSMINRFVGGLIGEIGTPIGDEVTKIINSYANVNITFLTSTSINNTGGLIGLIIGNATFINNSFSTGTISNNINCVGGLVGRMSSGFSNISNSYWNNLSSNPSKGVGCSTGGSNGTAIQNNIAYFYNISNSPMINWSYPPWMAVNGGGTALPILNISIFRTGYVYWPAGVLARYLPFFNNDTNPRNFNISKDTSQVVIFYVNATGSVGTYDFWSEAYISGVFMNTTTHFNVTIQAAAAAAALCANYSGSGNYVINCSDNCETQAAQNIGNNDIIINMTGTSTGSIFVKHNITNFNRLITSGLNSTSRCLVYCVNGACFQKT